ncbi:MAG: DUF262 domain-containing protein [Selenomonadaceae bacterium]|nr:DUF262 domain-containing protein [Selenomonadaceae bacterium]
MLEVKKFNLVKLLEKIECRELQLPDFQRDWVWDDLKIKSLLESVICGFPINSILLLACDSASIKFSCRPVSGIDDESELVPQQLILDGQQRLTSLFGALFSDKPVKCGDKEFFYYVDMKKAVTAVQTSETDDDLIVSVNEKRKLKSGGKIKLDLSTPEKEFAADMFPMNKLFKGTRQWLRAYERFHANEESGTFTDIFDEHVINKISAYEIVSVELEKNTPLESVCKIFEKVNIGGVKLDVFDLLTAIFAAHKTDDGKSIGLRKDLDNIRKDFADNSLKILSAIERTDFITALTLLVSYEKFCADKKISVSCKGEDVLKLDCGDYLTHKDPIAEGFVESAKFLKEEGITTRKYLPYKPQLIPMAAIFAKLNSLNKNDAASRKKIRQWYWCSVFSEAYRDGQGGRFAKDIVQVMDWIVRDKKPEIIDNIQIGAWDLMKAKSIQSAIYKGILSIIFKNGAKDFLAGRNMGTCADYAESIEIHHIFPKKYCAAKKIPRERYDNVANRTPIMKRTNRIIGDNAPSIYLEKIKTETGLTNADINEFLKLHFADPELGRADNFDAFIVDRAKKILDAVEELTGRKVVGRDSPEIKSKFGAPLI